MSHWIADEVHANGIRMHYVRTEGGGPPLVLCHGITDNGLCWSRVAQALEDRYTVIMPDARGHGHSQASADGYTWENLAEDLAGLIRALGLEGAALMGHSMGAATAAIAAARHPELVGCAILEDPPWRQEPSTEAERAARAEEWRATMAERQALTREALLEHCRRESPTWDELECGPWADAKLQVSPRVLDLVRTAPVPWREVVPRIACPTLLVTGDPAAGAIVTPEVARSVVEMNGHFQVAHIDGAGHSVHRERFGPYVQAVAAFLAAAMA